MWEELIRKFNYEKIIETILLNIIHYLPNIIASIIIILIFYLLWKLSLKLLSLLFKRIEFDLTIQNFIFILLKSFIFTIALITVLSQLGINTTSIITSLGVVGLTIGFAAKDVLSNIISGIFIFWDRPFVIGDLVEINGYYGKIENITMRTTRLVTVDGKMISIPNNQIINSMVASYTNFPHLRVDINFTVATNENLKKIREILFKLVDDENIFLKNPPPELVLQSINDYNIELIFRVWIKNEKEHIKIRYMLREQILETLLEHKINMPYETIQILLKRDIN
ncbi:MAG: hypothetical protein KatS3mg129_1825 [Leptospiraceae bacterium]|nr:MAG: hypothetical protein KatS3mg129_1825 [Leptospiraceae bacterium]